MTGNLKSVSAVIPCFNHGRYIKQCVDSLSNQTYAISEILIIDDGSTDNLTLEVLKKLESLSGIQVISGANRGVSNARNTGFQRANSDFVLTIDSDDYLAPTFVEKAINRMNGIADLGAVSSWVQEFGQRKRLLKHRSGDLYDFFLANRCVNCALIKKEAWEKAGGYDETMLEGLEDWDFWIRVLRAGYRIEVLPEPLFFYRIKEQSRHTKALTKHEELYRTLLENHKDFFFDNFPDSMLTLMDRLEERNTRLINSSAYKVGNTLVSTAHTLLNALRLSNGKK